MLHRPLNRFAGDMHQLFEVGVVLLLKIRHHVRRRQAFAVRIKCAFRLVGGDGAAPQEALRKPLLYRHVAHLL
ncbi:hypothetical protein D3C75_1268160 [compost metagenome]